MESRVQVLIIGAGIVGCSTAYHLSRLGVTNVVVVEQGPLFATGGSTSHAPGLVFQTSPSQATSQLAVDTVQTFTELELDGEPCFHQVGGIEVATTPSRWDDLKRKRGLATSWGITGELLSPNEVRDQIPQVNPGHIYGGWYVPTDGIAKPVRAGEAMAREAERHGVRFQSHTAVLGFERQDGQIRTVHTDRGDFEVEIVLCAAGAWGARVGRMAGVSVPVQPVAHQYAVTTPVPGLRPTDTEVAQPLLRHQDSSMYFRQAYDRYGIGSYQHRVIPMHSDEMSPTNAPGHGAEASPAGGGWKGMSTVHEFTPEDFAKPWADACGLVPVLEETEVAEGMNGVFLFTADGGPVLGPSPEVTNFWMAEAVWITHSAGVGRAMAEWISGAVPSVDVRSGDVRRFEPFAHSSSYVTERSSQTFREVYDVTHPQQPPEQPRPLRTSPFFPQEQDLGAVFLEANGWERPHWYESNKPLVAGRNIHAPGAWAGRYWSPIIGAEHQATRERVAMYDMTSLSRAEVSGRGALALLQRLTTNQLDRKPGYVTYTLMLEPTGGVRSDITVARLAADLFQVGCNGRRDIEWMRDNADEDVTIRDITGGTCCIGLWGPRARDVLHELADTDVSHENFRFFRAKQLFVGEVPVTALRLSYVGELGWELYTSAEFGRRLWNLIAEAGSDHGIVPAGRGAFNGLRLEKGYRAWGGDMWTLHDPDEAGVGFAVRPDKGEFIGRDALLRKREHAPQRRLCCLGINDDTVLMGSEPVRANDIPVGFTTSAGYGYSIDTSLAYAWLPAELAKEGTDLEVTYFEQNHPATVLADPVFDPEMTRMRC